MSTPSARSATAPSMAARGGLIVALLSAATFGTSGATAKSLLITGWSVGGVVLVRLTGAAVILISMALIVYRRGNPLGPGAGRTLVIYGVVAIAATQLAYFNAVRRLDVGVALLLEFLAPILILTWTSLRARRLPDAGTLVGAALAMLGLIVVLDVLGTSALDPIGVAWGLTAAVCLSGFFLLSAHGATGLPVLVMAAGGTAVGALTILLAGATGLLPLAVATDPVLLAGRVWPWQVPVVALIGVATVVAYLTGIGAIKRLGTRVASFIGLTEVLFAVLFAWLLLAELPGRPQLIGGVLIIVGIVIVEQRERGQRLPVSEGPTGG
jgi:drug/metabolite transporter (DMT)-like permease